MKILVVCQYYWPEPYPIADACEELVRRGHEVDVVTGVPNYPIGEIYPGYRWGKNRHQVREGVRITRTFTIGRRKNKFFRFLNYASFALSSCIRVLGLPGDYDVVFTNQGSPVTMSAAAVLYGRKHRKPVVLYCMDLWPASLAAGGVGEQSPIYRAFEKISGVIYRGADRILVTSGQFRDYLCEKFGIDSGIIQYHPQYANGDFCPMEPVARKDTVDLMFAGNVGTAQSMETVLEAAARLQERKELRWHIVGDGSAWERTAEQARTLKLENVIFHGRKPQEEMPRYYARADAMLVTLTEDAWISMTLPQKVQTYLAAGKPIIGAANGEIPRTISQSGCGFCAAAGDGAGLARAVEDFLNCPNRNQLGENGRRYYEAHFSRERFMDELEHVLAELISQNAQEEV